MVPTITFTPEYPSLNLPHKIRKPVVEKMRRDRINNSIEEIKALLGPQLLNQQPDSKLEKADILEMTVCLLRRQLQLKTLPQCDAVEFSRCTQEVAHSSSCHLKMPCSSGVSPHLSNTLMPVSDDDLQVSALPQSNVLEQQTENCQTNSTLWRPW